MSPRAGSARRRSPLDGRDLTIEFDFIDHVLWLRTSDGHVRQLMLRPMTVAEFYADVMVALRELGIAVRINEMPNEIPGAVPFPDDRAHAAYDRDFVQPVLARAARARTRCSRISARAFSARRARCISSGAASTSR